MNATLTVAGAGTGTVSAQRFLTRTDLMFCVLPIAAFLSIVSLV
jgi:hypothetical protein